MERRQAEPKKEKAKKEPAMDDDVEDDEDDLLGGRGGGDGCGVGDDDKKRRSSSSSSAASGGSGGGVVRKGGSGLGGLSQPCCQAEKCMADLTDAKRYHRRHKVCEPHSKAPSVMVAGLRQRFCQQCSRFHELSEFDEAKRSCRRRLAGHNERRRKSSSESQGEGSNRCRQADQSGRMQITLPGNPTYKHFQIR